MGWYQVTDTIHHTDKVIIHLTIDGETLETTPEHPFYVEGTGWVNAEDLRLGDDIRNADGETGEVESIEFEQTQQEMYNLTVDEAHTFFVGDGQWLVHNAGVCDLSSTKSILDYLHNNGIARQVDTVKIPMRAQDTFFDNRYVSLTLEKRLDLYRVGTSDIPLGQYFSLDYPKSVLDARINNAILPMWPDGGVSPLDTVFAWNFPQNTTVHLGLIKPQSPTWLYQGMNHQIFVNQPWNISGKIFSGKWPIPNILR